MSVKFGRTYALQIQRTPGVVGGFPSNQVPSLTGPSEATLNFASSAALQNAIVVRFPLTLELHVERSTLSSCNIGPLPDLQLERGHAPADLQGPLPNRFELDPSDAPLRRVSVRARQGLDAALDLLRSDPLGVFLPPQAGLGHRDRGLRRRRLDPQRAGEHLDAGALRPPRRHPRPLRRRSPGSRSGRSGTSGRTGTRAGSRSPATRGRRSSSSRRTRRPSSTTASPTF